MYAIRSYYDSLVLAGDAVIAACVSQYQKLLENHQVFVMADDITARGLSLKTGLTINYQELVRLVADLDSPVCW